jgi:hypothetical protein
MHDYQYQPLQHDDSIRVLVLHPSSNPTKPIICTVQHIRLFDPTISYEALSYTWGDITQKDPIYFHGGVKKLLVGRTCHDALQHLRQETSYRLLWIDAICIDQQNPTERTHQVRMMDKIYNRAAKVVVFLGEHTPGSRVLFKELAEADKLLAVRNMCIRPPPSQTVIGELEKLFSRPWFKRVWVLQEVCQKDSVIFMCGDATTSFYAIVQLYHGYSHTKVAKKRWPFIMEWMSRFPEEYATPQLTLWHRLHESRDCLATDPRDKIFALKSLAGSRQADLDNLIDYERSLEECFIQVAEFLLPILGLRILTAIRHTHNKDMPSWMPDWSQTLPLHRFYLYTRSAYSPSDKEYRDAFKDARRPMHQVRTIRGKTSGRRLELLTTGFQYAPVVERSQEFSFKGMEEAETHMRRLYYSLVNLQNIFDFGKTQNDRQAVEHLGKNIAKGKCSISLQAC